MQSQTSETKVPRTFQEKRWLSQTGAAYLAGIHRARRRGGEEATHLQVARRVEQEGTRLEVGVDLRAGVKRGAQGLTWGGSDRVEGELVETRGRTARPQWWSIA